MFQVAAVFDITISQGSVATPRLKNDAWDV